MKQLITFSFLIILTTFLPEVSAQPSLPIDSSQINERRPSTSLSDLKREKDYQYGSEMINPVRSWWEELKDYINKAYDDFFNNKRYGAYRKFFVYLLLMLTLAYFIMRLFGVNLISPFHRNDNDFDLNYSIEKETIHGRDFRKELEDAVKNNNLKLAVRLYYLRTLKQLSEKGMISWQPNKTNRSYYYELKPAFQKDFGKLTEVFEYCWYGNFEIRKSDFEEIRSQFESFNAQ